MGSSDPRSRRWRVTHLGGQAIGDFRKLWQRACTAIGLARRLGHDLRRSGVKHLIDSGNDLHTVMAFSGHRTPSMLRRYDIIDLDDLAGGREGERSSGRVGRARDGSRGQNPQRARRVNPCEAGVDEL